MVASDITLAVGDGIPGSAQVSQGTDPRPPDSVFAGTDPMAAIGIQTLSQAVEMLRQDVEHERERGDQAERQAAEGRKRIDELLHELADARTAAMITGCEAAALRSRLEILTDERRRPWWRGWFR